MSKKKIAVVIIILAVIINVFVMTRPDTYAPSMVDMCLELSCDYNGNVQIYYSNNGQYTEENSIVFLYSQSGEMQQFYAQIRSDVTGVRLDFPDECNEVTLKTLRFSDEEQEICLTEEKLDAAQTYHIDNYDYRDGKAHFQLDGDDASIIFDKDAYVLDELVHEKSIVIAKIKKAMVCALIDLLLLGVLFFADKFMTLPIELYQNRSLIWKLSKNDFKTRYAGSYLGIFWAFVQPVVTILVYWLVFDKGLNVGSTLTREGIEVPFVLWLTAGLVPWFFFQEALMNGTNALIEYNYLVKKVVFKISILPIIKIVSALFVHMFFVVFVLVLFSGYGYMPDFYTLQVVYYSFCMFVLVLALCYTTCSVVIFFRDLSQIINIILQVGVWATPIMWQLSIVPNQWLQMIFKLNPMYYIVEGYRNALINKVWFFKNIYLTIYFWGFVAVMFAIGTIIFKRLKVHFADVL